MAGGPHHTVLTTAVPVSAIRDLATITGTELVTIDIDTVTHEFERELRWNSVYYHLADGL
jgi:L-arabinose isomerase